MHQVYAQIRTALPGGLRDARAVATSAARGRRGDLGDAAGAGREVPLPPPQPGTLPSRSPSLAEHPPGTAWHLSGAGGKASLGRLC